VALAPGLGVSVGVGVTNGVDVGAEEGVGEERMGRSGVQVGDGTGDGAAGAKINRSAPMQ
jgi:hypothetical protein